MSAFFAGGGAAAWLVRTPTGTAWKRALDALDGVAPGAFGLVCLAGASEVGGAGRLTPARYRDVVDAAARLCERRRAFLIVDPPSSLAGVDGMRLYRQGSVYPALSANAAIYFPRIVVPDPLRSGASRTIGPSGAVAGCYAKVDATKGVWEAPAGTDVRLSAATPADPPGPAESAELNALGINTLRSFPVHGTVVWGARTLQGADRDASDWKYVPVRRTALLIEQSIDQATQWAHSEPNDEALWATLRQSSATLLHGLFKQGAFAGVSPRDAYFVRCDADTTSQADIDAGVVNIVVGFAPARPAEFIVLRILQRALEP